MRQKQQKNLPKLVMNQEVYSLLYLLYNSLVPHHTGINYYCTSFSHNSRRLSSLKLELANNKTHVLCM